MASTSIAGASKVLGEEILDEIRGSMGDAWNGLKKKDKTVLERVSKKFARLSIDKMAGKDVERDLAIIKAIIANLTYAESTELSRAFWESAKSVVGSAAKFLIDSITESLVAKIDDELTDLGVDVDD